jgi:hypothetical protein
MVFAKCRPGYAAPIRPGKWSEETTVIHYTEHPSVLVLVGNSKKIIYRVSCDLGEKLFLMRVCYQYMVARLFRKTVVDCTY